MFSQPLGPLDQKLLNAIRKDDAAEVERLLEKGANPSAIEANAWPAVVVAAGESLDIVKLLVSKGADINARESDQGWTPLTQAITHRRTDVVLYLLKQGADPMSTMADGTTPLHLAVRFAFPEATDALLMHKVDVNARTKENPNVVSNPRTDKQVALQFEPGYRHSGRTPLFELAPEIHRYPDVAKRLIEAGADLNAVDDNGRTLLHEAVKMGSADAVGDLLARGLDPNATSRQGYTPLHVAVRCGFGAPSIPIIRKLLASGSNPIATTKQGDTPEDLLRADTVRLFSQTGLSSAAVAQSMQLRKMLRNLRDALKLVNPSAQPLQAPNAQVAEGWSVYPALEIDTFSGESKARFERKVKTESGRTLLALTYRHGADYPTSIQIAELELNEYEPLEIKTLTLRANHELVVAFPAPAGHLGGSVSLKFSFQTASSSGSGNLGDAHPSDNPSFTFRGTPSGNELLVLCSNLMRPMEFRIDNFKIGGKTLPQYRGRVFTIQPPVAGEDHRHDLYKDAVPIAKVPVNAMKSAKVELSYSTRLQGNKRWRSSSIPLGPAGGYSTDSLVR